METPTAESKDVATGEEGEQSRRWNRLLPHLKLLIFTVLSVRRLSDEHSMRSSVEKHRTFFLLTPQNLFKQWPFIFQASFHR